jgi:thiamine pyrophosphokinase
MDHITIFANGEIDQDQIDLPPKGTIIAADGGARHCLRLGIRPEVVIGDFDSLTDEEIAALEAWGCELRRHPADKDETDLELALNLALEYAAHQVTFYGLLGGRWDMSFANLLLLAAPKYAGIRFRVWSGNTEVHLLRGGETLSIQGQPGNTISVIPLTATVNGLTYEGLQWPLVAATLPFGTPRGVSNEMIGTEAQISLEKGTLLIFKIKAEER